MGMILAPSQLRMMSPFIVQNSIVLTDDNISSLSKVYTLTAPWTLSAWVRRSEIGAINNILGTSGEVYFNASNNVVAGALTSTAAFASEAIHYHVHVSNNGLYVNNVYQGAVTTTNLTNAKLFDTFDGFVSDVHLKSGTQAPTDFGKYDALGKWVPKAAAAGEHYLVFGNSAAWGENSGSGGAWTVNNILATAFRYESPSDDPVNGIGQFPIWDTANSGPGTFTKGNSQLSYGTWTNRFNATIKWPTTGKWYLEHKSIACSNTSGLHKIGGAAGGSLTFPINGSAANEWIIGADTSRLVARQNASAYYNLANVDTAWPLHNGTDIVGIYFDADNNAVWCTHNGAVVEPGGGVTPDATMLATVGTLDTTYAMIADPVIGQANIWIQCCTSDSAVSATVETNFGAEGFVYTPKTGFQPLLAALTP